MPFNLGPGELLLILAIALVVLGPKKLPEAGRSLGKGLREFKDSVSNMSGDKDEDEDTGAPEGVASAAAAGRAIAPSSLHAVKIARTLLDEIVEHAVRDAPNECCGLVIGRDGTATSARALENLAASPFRFDIDGKELIAYAFADEDERPAHRDLPLAHALGALSVADRRELRRRLARRGVAHRRRAEGQGRRADRALLPHRRRHDPGDRARGHVVVTRAACLPDLRRAASARRALLSLLQDAARLSAAASASSSPSAPATSAPARSTRATPRATSSASRAR